jgi:hypothetical protein
MVVRPLGSETKMTVDVQSARQSRAANGNQRGVRLMIGLAAAARLARDPHFQQRVVVLAIALAAASGLAREGQTRSLARLVAWDKHAQMRAVRAVKGKASRAEG